MVNMTLFSQTINKISRARFNSIVKKFQGDKHSKGINSWTHLVCMLFLHFAKANSIREIYYLLKSATGNLNHLGITKKLPSRSSLSYINKHRSWKIFRALYYELLEMLISSRRCGKTKLTIPKLKSGKKFLILDSTTVTLCLKTFNWAKYHQTKGAIKLHMLLDYDLCLPTYVYITEGRKSDISVAQSLNLPSNTVLVADRAYIDFRMLNRWHNKGIKFVIRLKDNILYKSLRENPLPENNAQHILKDEIIRLIEPQSKKNYPEDLRRIVVYDEESGQTIEIITNDLCWTAETVSELYKKRWQVEIFFKELKQHLKIKSFIGTSENAVLIQIWTALITILLLKYLKQIAKYNWSLSNLIAFT